MPENGGEEALWYPFIRIKERHSVLGTIWNQVLCYTMEVFEIKFQPS